LICLTLFNSEIAFIPWWAASARRRTKVGDPQHPGTKELAPSLGGVAVSLAEREWDSNNRYNPLKILNFFNSEMALTP